MTFPGETHYTHLLTAGRESTTNQSMATIQKNLISQWAFSGLFTVLWWGITYRSRNSSETPASSPKPTPEGVSTKTGNLGQLNRLESVLFKWSKTLLRVIFAAWFVLEWLSAVWVVYSCEPGHFQGLPKAILSCLCSGLRSFPVVWDYFNLRGHCYAIEYEEPEPSLQPPL